MKAYDIKGRVLLLGVQDVLGSHEEMEAVLHEEGFPGRHIPYEQRRYSLSKRQREFRKLFNTKFMHVNDLFQMMGFDDVQCLEVFDNEGPDLLQNLNDPI